MSSHPKKAKEATISLLRTASVVKRSFEALMHQHGITLQQFNVLRILRGAGETLPTMEVAARMIEPEPGITRLIGRLEKKQLVRRGKCKKDSRRMLCAITPAGLAVLSRLDEPLVALEAQLLGSMPDADLDTLVSLLERARHHVEPMRRS